MARAACSTRCSRRHVCEACVACERRTDDSRPEKSNSSRSDSSTGSRSVSGAATSQVDRCGERCGETPALPPAALPPAALPPPSSTAGEEASPSSGRVSRRPLMLCSSAGGSAAIERDPGRLPEPPTGAPPVAAAADERRPGAAPPAAPAVSSRSSCMRRALTSWLCVSCRLIRSACDSRSARCESRNAARFSVVDAASSCTLRAKRVRHRPSSSTSSSRADT